MTSDRRYRERRAAALENEHLRVTVLEEGGHVAEILDKATGINPLWTPQWPSIEPSSYDASRHVEYGNGVDAALLSGIMGHNLCLDIFGGPSEHEAAAGLPVHGEVSVTRFEISTSAVELTMKAALGMSGLVVERRISLHEQAVRIRESVENLAAIDHPAAWTEHVTLGAPFLERGVTEFRTSATRSKAIEAPFGSADYLECGATFDWPWAPRLDGGREDLRVYTGAPVSNAYTAHLLDPSREHGFFAAFSPAAQLSFGYVWRRADFPWLGIWEENHSRAYPPWNGRELTRGLEFGVSPFPESRRQMIERGRLFDAPTFRWIPAKSRVDVEYWVVVRRASAVPEVIDWPG
jgi:hypothetical protein